MVSAILENPVFDPFEPLPLGGGKPLQMQSAIRRNQRARRARILATTRHLLTDRGCEGITVREIAQMSELSLQTVYNLVGPRDRAIAEAISEYSLFVGRMARKTDEAPTLPDVVDMWIAASENRPDFTRQCNLILFTPSRHIYYRFRDIQQRGMVSLIRRQQAAQSITRTTSAQELAHQAVVFATGLWTEWADRPYPLSVLRPRLLSGLLKLLRD